MGGPEMAPHTPLRSERPGEPAALLFIRGAPLYPSTRSAVARQGSAEARRRSAICW